MPADGCRVVAVYGFTVVVTLEQAHATPAAQVDRWYYLKRHSPLRLGKLVKLGKQTELRSAQLKALARLKLLCGSFVRFAKFAKFAKSD